MKNNLNSHELEAIIEDLTLQAMKKHPSEMSFEFGRLAAENGLTRTQAIDESTFNKYDTAKGFDSVGSQEKKEKQQKKSSNLIDKITKFLSGT